MTHAHKLCCTETAGTIGYSKETVTFLAFRVPSSCRLSAHEVKPSLSCNSSCTCTFNLYTSKRMHNAGIVQFDFHTALARRERQHLIPHSFGRVLTPDIQWVVLRHSCRSAHTLEVVVGCLHSLHYLCKRLDGGCWVADEFRLHASVACKNSVDPTSTVLVAHFHRATPWSFSDHWSLSAW